MASRVGLLAVVPDAQASRYYKQLRAYADFHTHVVTDAADAIARLTDVEARTDILVVVQALDGADTLVRTVRQAYPRLLIVLVDEEADFAIPGSADDISLAPFDDDDLLRRIQRLLADRRLETLRADSLPAVRNVAKRLRQATGELGKLQAAAAACTEMNYDYVAVYRLLTPDPLRLVLRAQEGPRSLQVAAPTEATADDLIGRVAQTSQSRVAGPADAPTHPLVAHGRLGAVGCVPIVLSGVLYGVLCACRGAQGSITMEHVLMLELVAAQLAAAVLKENIA